MQKNKKLILYSTTRQYNPGDEFILFGIMNLLKSVGLTHNPVIYNRNQEINQPLSFLNPLRRVKSQSKWIKVLGSFLRISQVDNSFKDIHDLDIYDMVVFGGSPEWASTRLNPLYKKLQNFNKPILYLGLGSFTNTLKLPLNKKNILLKSQLLTYRDENLSAIFSDFNHAKYMPCPALFSVEEDDHQLKEGKIAIVFGVANASKGNHVSSKAMEKMITAYTVLSKKLYEVEIVCHYIDEIPFAKKIFPKAKIHYSYDAKDYQEIYKEYQYIVTSRVHGIGICASIGIPGTLIAHDGRASTVKGFLGDVVLDTEDDKVFMEDIFARIENSIFLSKQLKEHKKTYYTKYKQLVLGALNDV